jgi:hypothetical protein
MLACTLEVKRDQEICVLFQKKPNNTRSFINFVSKKHLKILCTLQYSYYLVWPKIGMEVWTPADKLSSLQALVIVFVCVKNSTPICVPNSTSEQMRISGI